MKIVAGAPTYDGTRYNSMTLIQLQALGVHVAEMRISLLARAFNECYSWALNQRAEGVTHFLLLHADIVPHTPAQWLQEMSLLSARYKAGILSAVVPIKTHHGFTSTAIETEDPWNPRKLTRDEVSLKAGTWTEPGLLVNSGLMLVDLTQPWSDKVWFQIHDRILQGPDGFKAETQPEDWDFSRQVRAAGGSIYATRSIRVHHFGTDVWST